EITGEGFFVVDAEKGGVNQKFVVKVAPPNKVVGTAMIREVKEKMGEFKAGRGVIMGGKRSTPNAEEMAEESGVELLVDYPRFNIFEHELVPRHEVISEEERKWLLETFHVREEQLPRIKDTDPAVKAIGAKPGDIIKITRRSPTAGETVFYRYVVKGKYAPQIAKEEYGVIEEGEEEVVEEEERWEEL
ncbi:MAG: DNA-directed RNA polymerase subunit H, partial [Candidatus Jordarchaeales archaeon]